MSAGGSGVTRRIIAETIESGDVLHYTITYHNSGDEIAHNVVFDNAIPERTTYIADSATGTGADITFTIDGGKNFKKPGLLTDEQQIAPPELYTHIRWVVREMPIGAEGTVSYSVKAE